MVSHGEYANGTHRQTDGRQTVTLRLLLDAASVTITSVGHFPLDISPPRHFPPTRTINLTLTLTLPNPNTIHTYRNLNLTDPTLTPLTPLLTLTLTEQNTGKCPKGNCSWGKCPFPTIIHNTNLPKMAMI